MHFVSARTCFAPAFRSCTNLHFKTTALTNLHHPIIPMPSLAPIQGVTRTGVPATENSHLAVNSGYLSGNNGANDLHGAGHMGVAPLDRIIMSLHSGLESEVEYALTTLTYYSCNEPKILDFSVYPLIGRELIKYFIRPYSQMKENKDSTVSAKALSLSCESLLTLRNAVQDLHNQQWLCQSDNFRKYAADALRFLVTWFFTAKSDTPRRLTQHNDLFHEAFVHLLDVLDPITCFYTNTPKNDPIFHSLLTVLTHTSDRYVLLLTLKCLYHLLFTKSADGPERANGTGSTGGAPDEDDSVVDTNNCIDVIGPEHLRVAVQCLLINDDELSAAVLLFLKQYLSSDALHVHYSTSVEASQRHRLRKLMEASSSAKTNTHILLKHLPELIVAKLPLVEFSKLPIDLPVTLTKRSSYSGVPMSTPKLPQKLYDIVIGFPEPLRATTWLRCCYEPYTQVSKPGDDSKDSAAGEVTQISLWKAYENQFEAIWKERLNPQWPNLLPAVDFIKNVSTAFPNSEAMVVSMPSTDPMQPPRKKFIIKGIQPRQFPVNVELGNFEALRRIPATSEETTTTNVPIGHIDEVGFEEALAAFNESILAVSTGLSKPEDIDAPWYSPINVLARDVLGVIVEELLELDTNGQFKNVFRQYNKLWLPNTVYANPGLVEQGYIDGRWLLYLL